MIPVLEAPRADYRYFSMITLSSRYLRGLGAFAKPSRHANESREQYSARNAKAYAEWLERASPRKSRGSVVIEATHFLLKEISAAQASSFYTIEDYASLPTLLSKKLARFAPDQWPIYYDERAHKPHSIDEPFQLHENEANIVTKNRFRMRMNWDWCDDSQGVRAEVMVGRGELPPAGPNRPGRSDSGSQDIEINEIDWPN